jgi:cation diffusion facilitator CzcD-associated flavoprotein CzcO
VPADVIIYGTGFDAHHNVTHMSITGRHDGSDAYLGTTVAGFPNLFVMTGPNTSLGHNSQIFMIAAQARHVVDCLHGLRRRGRDWLNVRAEVQQALTAWLRERMTATAWETGGCRS